MNHPTFPKISTSFAGEGFTIGEWVATEKIHGAHLLLSINTDQVRIGKRKAWLGESDVFFGWQLIAGELRERAYKVASALGKNTVIIYGELCGGAYPHKSVSAVPGLSAVQTGIWYSPHLEFVVFDIIVECISDKEQHFLSYEQMTDICNEAGLTTVPLLGKGKKVELDKLPIRFITKLPVQLGFPPIKDNFAEGYVLKPAFEISTEHRPLVKCKIPEFDEARFDESRAFDPNAALSFGDLEILCSSLVNGARVASARSKVGEVKEKIIDEVVLDVLIDMETTFPLPMRILDPNKIVELQTIIRQLTIQLLECS